MRRTTAGGGRKSVHTRIGRNRFARLIKTRSHDCVSSDASPDGTHTRTLLVRRTTTCTHREKRHFLFFKLGIDWIHSKCGSAKQVRGVKERRNWLDVQINEHFWPETAQIKFKRTNQRVASRHWRPALYMRFSCKAHAYYFFQFCACTRLNSKGFFYLLISFPMQNVHFSEMILRLKWSTLELKVLIEMKERLQNFLEVKNYSHDVIC